MNTSPNNETISKIEVTVVGIDRDFVVLEIKNIQEKIFWPRQELTQEVSESETLTLELKPAQTERLHQAIQKAKAGEKDPHKMREILEDLIN